MPGGGGMIDQETKQILIQKTWCHGQAIAPVYGTVCLWWYVTNEFQPTALLLPSLFLPYWCYLSYRSIFVEFSYRKILVGGVLAQISHIIVFVVALESVAKTMHLLMCIASALFFVETLAFLLVVTAFRPRPDGSRDSAGEPLQSYQNNDQLSGIL
mmetsp:Transcript_97443/g.146035  ORF Transcript_97443/g.146035 Transcript_97443/m.146035 type:complete len:156 (+) Transcript_97443:374-841(+)